MSYFDNFIDINYQKGKVAIQGLVNSIEPLYIYNLYTISRPFLAGIRHVSYVFLTFSRTSPSLIYSLFIYGIMFTKALSRASDDRYRKDAVLARASFCIWQMT